MLCAAVIERMISTNAGSVAFLRTSYSNEFRYKCPQERVQGVQVPTAANALAYMQAACLPYRPTKWWEMPLVQECGVGLKLFFFALRYFAVVFAVMAVVSIGQLALNYEENYYAEQEETNSIQAGGTLGSVMSFSHNIQNVTAGSPEELREAQSQYEAINTIKALEIAFDALYTFIFLVSILIYRVWTKHVIHTYRVLNPTLADYALKFTHLPETHIPALIKSLENAGIAVFDVTPIRHITKLVTQIKLIKQFYKRCFLQLLIDNDKKCTLDEIKRAIKKLEKLEGKVKIEGKTDLAHSVIVVFVTKTDRNKAMKLFKQGVLTWIYRKLCTLWHSCRPNPTSKWVLDVNAKAIPTPEDYYWENIRKKRWIHRLKFYGLATVLILSSSGIIFGFKYLQTRNKYPSKTECEANPDLSGCECILSDSEECQLDYAKFSSANVMIGLAVVCVNLILPLLLEKITSREKQSSKPRRKLSTMMKIFFALVINTSVVILAVNARFRTFQVTRMYEEGQKDKGYMDFDRGWYANVGLSILVSMAFGIVAPHYLMCAYYCLKQRYLPHMLRFFDTQLAYNNWAIGADMDLPLKSAIALVTIYGCFVYAGGIPWMLLICSLSLLTMFHGEKIMLKYYEKPNERSTILHTWFVNMLPGAVVIHCMLSLYMYGCEDIFPMLSPEDYVEEYQTSFNFTDYTLKARNQYEDKVKGYPGGVFFGLIALAVLLPLLVRKAQKKYQRKGIRQETVQEALGHDNFFGGRSYHISSNLNYKEVVESILVLPLTPDDEEQPHPPNEETIPLFLPKSPRDGSQDLTLSLT